MHRREIQKLKSKKDSQEADTKLEENISLKKDFIERLTSQRTKDYPFLKIIYDTQSNFFFMYLSIIYIPSYDATVGVWFLHFNGSL